MKKSILIRLLALAIVSSMILSLFACTEEFVDPEVTTTETEQSTNEQTTKVEETTTAKVEETTTAKVEETSTKSEETTTKAEETTTKSEETTTKAEETTTKAEETTTKAEETTTKAEETTTKAEETTTKAEETTTKVEETTTKAEETTTKVEETTTKAEETTTKAEETSTKVEETTTEAEETTKSEETTTEHIYNHKYIDNGNTHTTPSCSTCQMVGVEEAHNMVYDEISNTHICICGKSTEGHFVNINTNGTHTSAACQSCGIDAKTESHAYNHNGNGNFTCICGDEIHIDYFKYYSAKPKGHFSPSTGPYTDNGVTYYQSTPSGQVDGKEIWNWKYLIDNTTRYSLAEDQPALQNCRYVAFKIRTNAIASREDKAIELFINNLYTITISGITSNEWVTYIVDLELLDAYIKDADGKYPLMSTISLQFLNHPNATDYLDVDYFIANDNFEELLALVDTDLVQFRDTNGTKTLTKIDICEIKGVKHTYTDNGDGTHTVSDCNICGSANIAAEHTYTYILEGEDVKMKCTKCGAIKNKEAFMSFNEMDAVVYPYIDPVKEYLLAGAYADVSKYDYKQEKQSKGITVSWTINNVTVDELYIEISTNKDFLNSKKIALRVLDSSVELNFLLKNTTYYVRLTARIGEVVDSIVTQFATTDLGPRFVDAGGIYNNCRDLGGYIVNGKTVLQDMVFRGSAPDLKRSTHGDKLTDEGKDYFNNIVPIKTQIDLRGTSEIDGRTESSFDHAEYVHIPLTAYAACFGSAQANYYKEVFQLLADPENYPVYIHCAGGADRTGTVAALLLALLGVSEEEIIQDYVVTTFSPVCASQDPRSIDTIMPVLNGLKSYEGDTLSEKCESFLKSIGVTQREIFAIKAIMFGEDPDDYVYTTDYGISVQSYYYNTSESKDMTVNLNEDLSILEFQIDGTAVAFEQNGTTITVSSSVLAGLSDGNHTATVIFNETIKREFVFGINVYDITGELQVSEMTKNGDYTNIKITSSSAIFEGINYHFHTRGDSKFPLVKPNIMINGKTVREINEDYDLSDYNWTSDPAKDDARHRVPVSIYSTGNTMKLLVNTEWLDSYLNGEALTITICAGFEFTNNGQTYKVSSDVTYIYENGTWRRA